MPLRFRGLPWVPQRSVGFAGQGRAVGVADGDNLCALFACVAHCHQGVHGFTGLRECHDEGLLVHDGVAVAELVASSTSVGIRHQCSMA